MPHHDFLTPRVAYDTVLSCSFIILRWIYKQKPGFPINICIMAISKEDTKKIFLKFSNLTLTKWCMLTWNSSPIKQFSVEHSTVILEKQRNKFEIYFDSWSKSNYNTCEMSVSDTNPQYISSLQYRPFIMHCYTKIHLHTTNNGS